MTINFAQCNYVKNFGLFRELFFYRTTTMSSSSDFNQRKQSDTDGFGPMKISKKEKFQKFFDEMNKNLLFRTTNLLNDNGTDQFNQQKFGSDWKVHYENWFRSRFPPHHPPAVFSDYRIAMQSNVAQFYAKFQKVCTEKTMDAAYQSPSSSCEILSAPASPDVSFDDVVILEKEDHCLNSAARSARRHPNSGGILQRNWQRTNEPLLKFGKEFSFVVTSYNVLCQQTLERTIDMYRTCADEWLRWEYRWNLLHKEIQNIKSDIFCFQEVEEKYYDSHFKPLMDNLGFDGIYKKRTGENVDGCAVFWRNSKFSLDKMDLIEYRIANTFLDRDNVGIVVRLNILDAERRSSHKDRKIVVGNTHLLFNPGRGDIKLGQLAMLLARVQKLAKQGTTNEKYYPIILCGDFNAVPYSSRDVKSLSFTPLYRLIVDGHLSYDGLLRGDIAGQKPGGRPIFKPLLPIQCGVNEMCECFDENAAPNDGSQTEKLPEGCLRHGFKLISSYGHFTKRGTPEVTTCHGFDTANVDYIFYSSSADPLNNVDGDLLCKRRYSLPDRDEIKSTCGTLPNRTCGSDHLPLVVEFELS